ncbi:SH2 domain-containing protein 2A-like, partial [Columba livia]
MDPRVPAWLGGAPSRRETEQLLQDQPPGCFLVRFSESTVGFVLSYRGSDRCRHFVLDQLPDGRYVILGERSAHAELAELLRHYSTAPVTPYNEFLTPHEGIAPAPEEPIPFYAVGHGGSPRAPPQENIYSEVALAQQDHPAPLPRAARGPFSTLPPKCHMPPRSAHRRLLRSVSSQACRRRQLPAAPGKDRGDPGAATETQFHGHFPPRIPQVAMTNPALEFDDPIYGRRT